MRRVSQILFLIIIFLLAFPSESYGQFFYNGRGSASQKWYQIKAPKYKLLYPDYFEPTAIRIAGFLDTLQPYIGYGMPKRLIRTPMILYTEDQYSNGMVVWAPKRDEMVMTPPIQNTSTPWLKQLSIHEWRHVVQMSAMKTGLTKVATFVLGEAGVSLGLLAISDWQLEGDATNAETQLTEFGRGLQPDFTIEYRAMASKPNFLKLTTDLLVCGSYRQHIPDIYKYGYQIMRATETYVKPSIWGEIFDFSGKWPILVVPDAVYLRMKYKTSLKKIAHRAFAELDSIWQPYENVTENFEIITQPAKTYTTYETPLAVDGGVIAVRRDFQTPSQIVFVDTLGKEHLLKPTGGISSRPMKGGGKMYWTEYKPHPIYEKKNFSVIKQYDLRTNKIKRFRNWESNYLVTALNNGFATVANDSLANGYIRFFDEKFNRTKDYRFAEPTTLHGLAWDNQSGLLCFIAVDERGMWIGGLDSMCNVNVLRAPSAVTLSELRAKDGVLIFGSIQSGKDEIHAMNISTGVEYQLTQSRFGSTQPTFIDSTMYMRTYTPQGWMLARHVIDTVGNKKVHWSRLPQDILNPYRVKWEVPDVNKVAMKDTTTEHKIKRYTKFPRQFNFHSWAPIAVDFDGLYNERTLKVGFGATGFFQSTLSDMYGSLALGAIAGQFWGVGGFTYVGLPVQFTVKAEYGGGSRSIYIPTSVNIDDIRGQIDDKPYFSIKTQATLPLNFSGGHSYRLFQPSFSVTHYNSEMYNANLKEFKVGYQRWDASLWWSSNRRSAYQDLMPRLGYALRLGMGGTFDNRFSLMYYLWGRGYLPGIVKTHSMMVRASLQYQSRGEFNFGGKVMAPRAVVDNFSARNYFSVAYDYSFPLCYPDWGIPSVLYFKRISMNLFADYSAGRYFVQGGGVRPIYHHSYGADVTVDFNLIRSFAQAVTFTFAGPDTKSFYFGVSYNFKF